MDGSSPITDVAEFFAAITVEYECFERSILRVIETIPDCSAAEILLQCNELGIERNKLAAMDEQMLAIIELAGGEIAQMPMVHGYRVAFGRAAMACNNLYQRLQAFKAGL